jgi:hypothetical protein
MSTIIKMNNAVITELFDKVISSTNETERLLADKGINMPQSNDFSTILMNDHFYEPVKYINEQTLPKGMEAHIIALIKGGLS